MTSNQLDPTEYLIFMMTSSNGSIFRATDHCCGEFTGPRWNPRTKASDAELIQNDTDLQWYESCQISRHQTFSCDHYNDVIMGAIASQITSLTIVYSTVYSDADQRKYQSSAPLAFVRWIHRGPVNSPHQGPVKRKMFPLDDVIMIQLWPCCTQFSGFTLKDRVK